MNAPQRHHRHREEPKARPLRVGDTEKPGPEGKGVYTTTHRHTQICISLFRTRRLQNISSYALKERDENLQTYRKTFLDPIVYK